MENHQIDSNNKRRRSINEEDPLPKIPRQELSNGKSVPPKPTKIIDLNDDCLMKIFNRLDLKNLFNVAIANEWLRPAAADVYKQKFGSKSVIICRCDDLRVTTRADTNKSIFNKPRAIDDCSNLVRLNGLKTCLQYLRCFGSSMSKLSMSYKESRSKRYQHIHDYITKYCTDNLVAISFYGLPKSSMPQLEKPLKNVTTLSIGCTNLGKHFPLFAKLCPNVQTLELDRISLNAVATFQQLQHLSIDDRFDKNRKVLKHDAARLFNLHPQLQSIELRVQNSPDMPMDKLLQIIKSNTAITKLNVKLSYDDYDTCLVDSTDVEQLINEHPSLVELNLPQYEFSVENGIKMVQRLNALKKFNFWMFRYLDQKELMTKLGSEWELKSLEYNDADGLTQLIRKNNIVV